MTKALSEVMLKLQTSALIVFATKEVPVEDTEDPVNVNVLCTASVINACIETALEPVFEATYNSVNRIWL